MDVPVRTDLPRRVREIPNLWIPMPDGVRLAARMWLPEDAEADPVLEGRRLRLALATRWWPMVWPEPEPATLTLTEARLLLPARPPRAEDAALPPFPPPEGAAPHRARVLRPGGFGRRVSQDQVAGRHVWERVADGGEVLHEDTGLVLTSRCEDRFETGPDGATGRSTWSLARRDRHRGPIDAGPHAFRVCARLVACDADGEVHREDWDETIPRDLL